jgi:hypothetical protein
MEERKDRALQQQNLPELMMMAILATINKGNKCCCWKDAYWSQ